jgi:hypothetical protein
VTHSANSRDGKRRGDDFAPLTSDDLARFRRNAPAALARRGTGFVAAELGRILGLALAGLIPIAGFFYFRWSASEMLVFLLVGAWLGILCDAVKFFMLPSQVQRFGDAYYDDWHVWVVANALRRGEDVASGHTAPKSHLHAKYQPALGVFVDFVVGGIATALICVALAEVDFNFRTELWENAGLWKWLALLAAYDVALTVWEITRHKLNGNIAGRVKVAVGMRGLGLFLLLFVVVMIHDALGANGSVARGVIVFVNAAILATAAFNALGLFWMRTETNWLRDYLRIRPQASDD